MDTAKKNGNEKETEAVNAGKSEKTAESGKSEIVHPEQYIGVLSTKYINLNFDGQLKGRFVKGSSGLCFETRPGRTGKPVSLRLWKSPDPEMRVKYDALYAFLEEKNLPVVLQGSYLKKLDVYAVTGMALDESPYPFSSTAEYSEGFLQTVVERLKRAPLRRPDQEQSDAEHYFGKNQELLAYSKIFKDTFPAWVTRGIKKELLRLEANTSSSGSINSSDTAKHALTALRYLVNIDWEKRSLRTPSQKEARETLDRRFFGLEEVKRRILEIIAKINRTGELPLWGILLNGPAGTGKTSIAKALAELLGLPVIPIDVSSLGSEPEALSGSSRIYTNAKPGAVLEKMLEAKSGSGILLINEIDKATNEGKDGGRGNVDTLLTLLDRQGFYDNFLEESIPTKGLFAVATCNEIEKLSAPMRDRFLIINIPPYTPEEKETIWKNYVMPQVLESARLRGDQLVFDREATAALIESYALEPGVRDLEQFTERFADELCTVLEEKGEDYCHTVTLDEVRKLLGPGRKVTRTFAVHPGEINAIYYYQGAAYCFMLEAAVTAGTGQFRVLGPVGELQKEYIRVAYECVRNTTPCDLTDKDVTIFVSQAIPASVENHVGCAAYAAICSLLVNTGLKIQDIAFVGGVDLNGNLYFDDADIRPLLRAMKKANIKTVYAPVGVSEMMRGFAEENDDVTFVEAQNAAILISMAVTASKIG